MRNIEGHPITTFLNQIVTAWNQGDLEGVCRGYAEDACIVTTSGCEIGRDAILAYYRVVYADPAYMGTMSLEVVDLRFDDVHSHDVIVAGSVVLQWRLTREGGATESGHSLITLGRSPDGTLQVLQDVSC